MFKKLFQFLGLGHKSSPKPSYADALADAIVSDRLHRNEALLPKEIKFIQVDSRILAINGPPTKFLNDVIQLGYSLWPYVERPEVRQVGNKIVFSFPSSHTHTYIQIGVLKYEASDPNISLEDAIEAAAIVTGLDAAVLTAEKLGNTITISDKVQETN
jgi:hypothetical protein